ncbi:hypothetical protein DXG03_001408 [Asterophora parasitica]|uniref:RraA-like protein n=1 Tax=Asterophora parasitica TaxID=117018 RepID=A0A9P7KDY9_9AGAR|nr:hypothetical protein DXG03_001408 [Asterophora parasitica]
MTSSANTYSLSSWSTSLTRGVDPLGSNFASMVGGNVMSRELVLYNLTENTYPDHVIDNFKTDNRGNNTIQVLIIAERGLLKFLWFGQRNGMTGQSIPLKDPNANRDHANLFAQYWEAAMMDVIEQGDHSKNAVWGGLMSAGAQARSAVGVIISGRCRDLAEHQLLQFPVFARGHSTLGQSPFTRPSEINVPLLIQLQGNISEKDPFPPVTVEPGDWMVADIDGVVCVPKALESRVIELASKGRAVDELCMRYIQAGNGVQASFKAHRGK